MPAVGLVASLSGKDEPAAYRGGPIESHFSLAR